jgi:hypothetical protein
MKRIIALLLVLLMLGAALVSCTTPATTTDEPSTSGDENSKVEIDPEKQTYAFKKGYYSIKTTEGVELCWQALTVGPKADKTGDKWEETVWYIMTAEKNGGRETVSHIYSGDTFENVLSCNIVKPNGELILDGRDYAKVVAKQAWYVRENGDGTFKIVSSANSKFALTHKDGAFVLDEVANASSFTFTETENKKAGDVYAEWLSKGGDVTVRLPVDVVNQVYERVKKQSSIKDEAQLKAEIEATMQRFADNTQNTYESLIELTGFIPYPHMVVKADEHQGVMAGVVGNNCNIFVNVDWYVDDMTKMYLRWEKNGQNDYNFCTLHEMGHMFDWDRGWTFESEMQTDLKASYVLWDHKDDEKGAWGAPAEYNWDECYNIDTIDVGASRRYNGAYQGLSADMRYETNSKGEVTGFTYSIYRSAQMYTSYVKYCEATEGLNGFEGLKAVFHWYQDNGKTSASYGHNGAKKLHEFNAKLEEFMGLNVEKYMLENARETLGTKATWCENDWYATIANQEHGDKRLK